MLNIIKNTDLSANTVAEFFYILNNKKLELVRDGRGIVTIIISKIDPSKLNYPEGWSLKNGYLTNEGTTTHKVSIKIAMQ